MNASHPGYRWPDLHSTADQVMHLGERCTQITCAGRASHDKGDLTAHLAGGGPFDELGKGPSADLLVRLGQLPAQGGPTVAAEAI